MHAKLVAVPRNLALCFVCCGKPNRAGCCRACSSSSAFRVRIFALASPGLESLLIVASARVTASTMQIQQHAQGCRATSWRSHCFHNLCRVGPLTASGSHTSSSSGPRTLRTHRAPHRHVQWSSAAGAKHRTVTCQAQEPVAQRMSVKVGNTQVNGLKRTGMSLELKLTCLPLLADDTGDW